MGTEREEKLYAALKELTDFLENNGITDPSHVNAPDLGNRAWAEFDTVLDHAHLELMGGE